jgi:Protein of unknown function (DUF3606)
MISVQAANDKRLRNQIAMDDAAAVRRWIKHLGMTQDELQSAVDKVGNSAAAVRKQIGLARSRSL